MARTPTVTRESVPEREREAFDAFVANRGEIPTTGPGSVILNAPEVAQRALGLAQYLRTDTSLNPRIRELAMLLAARENDCQFIWNAHAPAARREGLRDEIVDALRDKQDLPGLADDEAAVVNYGREFFRTPPRQPGSFRRSGGPLRRQRRDGTHHPDGLLRHARVQRERLRRGAPGGACRDRAADLGGRPNNASAYAKREP